VDLKQIEKLMTAMEESRIKRVVLKKEGFEIEIERECAGSGAPVTYIPTPVHHAPPPPHMEHRFPPNVDQIREADKKEKGSGGVFVTSPMVGTFYSAPSPEDPSFVKVGDTVDENTVVCIIEAMKVMNEVKAGMKGKVVETLSRSGDPVEFGTRIFRIEPS
jgi:acetyl-CoA carboxylase biotin carboxyl carrier protein